MWLNFQQSNGHITPCHVTLTPPQPQMAIFYHCRRLLIYIYIYIYIKLSKIKNHLEKFTFLASYYSLYSLGKQTGASSILTGEGEGEGEGEFNNEVVCVIFWFKSSGADRPQFKTSLSKFKTSVSIMNQVSPNNPRSICPTFPKWISIQKLTRRGEEHVMGCGLVA